MGVSRQEYWSGLPCPPPGDLPNQGLDPELLRLLPWQAGSLPLTPPGNGVPNFPTGTFRGAYNNPGFLPAASLSLPMVSTFTPKRGVEMKIIVGVSLPPQIMTSLRFYNHLLKIFIPGKD